LIFEILLVLALIVANGVFSMSETAVVSSRQTRLLHRAAAGDEGARRALELAQHPNVFLATVQIGITLIGILSGAFGGARLSQPVADAIDSLPVVGKYAETVAFALVVIVITYFSLVVGELVPKRIALNNPERIASTVAGPMRFVSTAVAPLVHLLGVSTDALLRLLGVRHRDDTAITEEEFGVMLEQGTVAGVFSPAERDMAGRIFALADDRVSAHITPRPDVIWLDIDADDETIVRTVMENPFSRFPVAEGTIDRVKGVVRAKEVLGSPAPRSLSMLMSLPLVIPETLPALLALERFRQASEHFAVVIDEYGGTAGVVTLQDILEAIVGDLPEIGDTVERGAVQRADGSWLFEGGLAADAVADHLNVAEFPGFEDGLFETLAGFIVTQFGHLPSVGEFFVWGNWRFEVVDMDGHRVDQVLVEKAPDVNEEDG